MRWMWAPSHHGACVPHQATSAGLMALPSCCPGNSHSTRGWRCLTVRRSAGVSGAARGSVVVLREGCWRFPEHGLCGGECANERTCARGTHMQVHTLSGAALPGSCPLNLSARSPGCACAAPPPTGDMMVLRNIDDVFGFLTSTDFAAVPNLGFNHEVSDWFNSGFMLLRPSSEVFRWGLSWLAAWPAARWGGCPWVLRLALRPP